MTTGDDHDHEQPNPMRQVEALPNLNCCGAGKGGFRRTIQYIHNHHKANVIALFETKISGTQAAIACAQTKFSNSVRIEANGVVGGTLASLEGGEHRHPSGRIGDHFIHTTFMTENTTIHLIADHIILADDFNCILYTHERRGSNGQLHSNSMEFLRIVNAANLINLGYSGSTFTWRRGSSADRLVDKRLDKGFTNVEGRLLWPDGIVKHLTKFSSDHCPILFCRKPSLGLDCRHKPFCLEACWLKHPAFSSFIKDKWRSLLDTPDAMSFLHWDIRIWNKQVFGSIQVRNQKLMEQLLDIQLQISNIPTDHLINEEALCNDELALVLEQEEILWLQKSRESWLTLGDRNTSFFHVMSVIKRNRNKVAGLESPAGV
ncbi:hypothetical protein V2J09_017032 [Rumex salicifolius]